MRSRAPSTTSRRVLLAGPAGTGKTTQCLERLRAALAKRDVEAYRRTVLVLPSQEHVDRLTDIVLRHTTLKGFGGSPIVTINTLLRMIGAQIGRPVVTEVGKRAILQEVVARQALGYFAQAPLDPPGLDVVSRGLTGQAREQTGWLDALSGFIRECKEHLVEPDRLAAQAARLRPQDTWVADKVDELARLSGAYQARLEELAVLDEEDRAWWTLRQLAQRPRRPMWDLVMFDGFFDFTKFQLALIEALSQRSRETVVTLTIDRSRPELFHHVEQTYQALETLGFRAASGALPPRRTMHEDLIHLERELFRPEAAHDTPSATHLEILEATGTVGELEWIARRILRWRAQTRLHWSDVAIIFRAIGPYLPVVQSVFRRFQIPVAIHERRRLAWNPVVRQVVETLQLFAEGWPRERLWRLLRTRLGAGEERAVRQFERTALVEHVDRGREAWLALAQRVSEKLHHRLRRLAQMEEAIATSPPQQVAQGGRALIRFWMSRPQGGLPIERWRDEGGALRALDGLMEQWAQLAQHHASSLEGFTQYLVAAAQTALYSAPPRLQNAVQVYDISLARQKEYKVVFLAGLLEQAFPKQVREDPLLKDAERRLLNQDGELLAERLPRAAIERYWFYLGVTRAKERLVLTYPKCDTDGKELLPSFYVDEVRRLFPKGVPVMAYHAADWHVPVGQLAADRDLEEFVVAELFHRRQPIPGSASLEPLVPLELYNRRRARLHPLLESWRRGDEAVIRDPRIRAWFQQQLGPYSPTRLEVYAKCSFKYFAERVVKLQEPVSALDAITVGTMAHRVLEAFYRRSGFLTLPSKDHWILLTDFERAQTELQAILNEVSQEWAFVGERPYQRALAKARLFDLLVSVLEKEAEYERARQTIPRHVELAFGLGATPEEIAAGTKLDYVRVNGGQTEILIEGKIDRVDLHPSGRWGVIIDYKLGKEFRPQEFEEGLSLQLPVYLLALRQLLKVHPAGAEFYSLTKLRRSGIYDETAAKAIGLAKGRETNVLDHEAFESLLARAQAFIRADVQGIQSATIRVNPKNCDWCPLTSVCRFEKWRLAYRKVAR